MSSIQDPRPGDGPNKGGLDPSDSDRLNDSRTEEDGEEESGEGGGAEGRGRPEGDETKTASKGINPVQHSE